MRPADDSPCPDGPKGAADTAVRALYHSLSDAQKKLICYAWDHPHPDGGLLRTYVSNFWHVSRPVISSRFYSRYQRSLLFEVFRGTFNPDWQFRILKQVMDDHTPLPWGGGLTCAFFGAPGTGRFQFVMTGRHITLRLDGDRDARMALGGPILHGHAPGGRRERPHHPGNVFWNQARRANRVYTLLDGKQQQRARVARRPRENAIAAQGPGARYPGLPCSEMSHDQQAGVCEVLEGLLEPYRLEDRRHVLACLEAHGGLEQCSLAFYPSDDRDDGEWETWRLEGPALVWYFRGFPHVHIWINVANVTALPAPAP